MKVYADIFDYIKYQEEKYKKPVKLSTGKMWSMKYHINRSVLYRDSDIVGSKNEFTPIKNITRPILNLQYRTEAIDSKEVVLFANHKDKYHLSFLVKKYHDDVFLEEYDVSTYFDQLNRSRIDFGGGLSKNLATPLPEAVQLESIAFCDQRDILSRPIGLKHSFSADELLAMADKGWGKKSNGATVTLEEALILARESTKDGVSEDDIEIYEVHGKLPKKFANPEDDSQQYEGRIFICAFYQKKDSMERNGIILFTKLETESPFKFVNRDFIYSRAVGFGGAEEIFEDQTWTNYDEIRKQAMLDSAAKTIILSEDPAFTQRNKINNMENLEVADVEAGKKVYQMDTYPRNLKVFEESTAGWEEHAQTMGAAQDPIQGDQSHAGTAFAAIQAQIQQSAGLHDYRKGNFAKHLETVYRDWIIPHIEKKICEATTFLSELSLDELQYVTDGIVECEAQKYEKQLVLTGQVVDPQVTDEFKQKVRAQLKKKGNKFFIEILRGEFKGVSLGVKVSIAGKSKNLGKVSDAIVNILKFVISSNSPALGFTGTWELINQVIENEGLDPVDFYDIMDGFKKLFAQQQQQAQQPQLQQVQQQQTQQMQQIRPQMAHA